MNFDLPDDLQSFASMVRAWVDQHYPCPVARDLEGGDPEDLKRLWDDLAAAGFHGIGIPEEFGGQGGDTLTQSILARGLTRTLGGLSGVWGVSSFAGGKTLSTYGTTEQKSRFLPAIAEGTIRFSIAITEPGGGTDLLGGLATTVAPTGDGWVLNGQKMWSSGANTSDYLVVMGRVPGAEDRRQTTTVIVPTSAEGVSIRPIPKLGMRSFSSCEVFLDDVEVDADMIVGEEGRGWHQLLPTLNNERIITASSSLGILDGVLEQALPHLQEREAFGRPIGQFQALQHMIADITAWQHQSELLVRRAAWLQSQGRPCGVEATVAHYVTADYAVAAANHGIQMLGGLGYAMETDMQRYWRDARLYKIAPITTEMAKNMLAQSHGLPRSF